MVSCFPAVQYGPLYYRGLEPHKSRELSAHKGHFEAKTLLPDELKPDLQWWIANISNGVINRENPDLVITSFASKLGWDRMLLQDHGW